MVSNGSGTSGLCESPELSPCQRASLIIFELRRHVDEIALHGVMSAGTSVASSALDVRRRESETLTPLAERLVFSRP